MDHQTHPLTEKTRMDSPQEPIVFSPLFDDADADATFKSSDHVVFKIHRKQLQMISGSLSPGRSSMDFGETVSLPETSDVLEILFQFIHPPSRSGANYRQPSVMKMEPNLFFRVADAAEKYAILGAMNVCMTWMYHIIEDHPLQILNHSGKHGYTELSDMAAEISLPCSLADAAKLVTHPGTLKRWLLYYNHWIRLGEVLEKETMNSCQVLQIWRSEILYALAKNPKSIEVSPPRPTVSCNIPKNGFSDICICDVGIAHPWLNKILEKRAAIPKFSTVILVE